MGCITEGTDILIMNRCQLRETLLPRLCEECNASSNSTLSNKLSNIQLNGFLSLSCIQLALGAECNISQSLGFNIYMMRQELEHLYSEVLRRDFKFNHIFDFMAAFVLNQHFIPVPLEPLSSGIPRSYTYTSTEVTTYNRLNTVDKSSYQFIGLACVQYLISIGVDLEYQYSMT